jgi:hypothetical protein
MSKKTPANKDPREDFLERVHKVVKEKLELEKKFQVRSVIVIKFPEHKVPLRAKLAMWIINKTTKGRIDTEYSNLKQ